MIPKGSGSTTYYEPQAIARVCISYIIILDPDDDDDRAYVCNITPWLTPYFN